MKLIIFAFFFLTRCLASQVEIECDANGQILSYKYAGKTVFDSRQPVKPVGDKKSFEMQYPFKGYTRVQLGPSGKAKMESNQYLKVADLALRQGVDPFLAMGILSVEKTPLFANSSAVNGYLNAYGSFPVDARPAYSALNCSIEKPYMKSFWKKQGKSIVQHKGQLNKAKKKYDSSTKAILSEYNRLAHLRDALQLQINLGHGVKRARKRLAEVTARQTKINSEYVAANRTLNKLLPPTDDSYQRNLMSQVAKCGSKCHGIVTGNCEDGKCSDMPGIDLSTGDKVTTKTFCRGQNGVPNNHGDPPSFSKYGGASKGACCFKLTLDSSEASISKRDALGALGLDIFWNKRIPFAAKKVGPRKSNNLTSDDLHRLARIVQIWNGWGKMNVTEKIGSCLGQLNMKTNPAIGGKALDLTTNSIMNNDYLTNNVLGMAQSYGKPIKSIYCKYGGAGKKKFDGKKISQLINGRYLSSTRCARGGKKRRRRGNR